MAPLKDRIANTQRAELFPIFWGACASSIFVMGAFALFAFSLHEYYEHEVGRMLQIDAPTNGALLQFFSQTCALGGAGGYLFVLQIIFEIAHSNRSWFAVTLTGWERALIGFLIPIKGVIAGAMSGGVLGGIMFATGGVDRLASSYLFLLGLSCLAGYSEQFLQRIMHIAAHHPQ